MRRVTIDTSVVVDVADAEDNVTIVNVERTV